MEFQKKVAKSGSVSIPVALRRELGLEAGEHMSVSRNQAGEIILMRIHGTCIICGGHDRLARIKGKFICRSCVEELIERNLGGKLFGGSGSQNE